MCGIAGQVRNDGAAVDARLVERMCDAQRHRGPDSRGVHAEGPAGLGIQRLRVIDLDTGDQPIFNEDRSLAVVLNGEIYNFRELRAELEARGHRFRTQGDTETIVHLYEERGTACVEALEGMFAFALWDARHRELLLARDRVGKKPLFYAERDGALSFASELPALMRDPEIPRELDHGALDRYLAYGYVPAPFSAYRAVRKLPPASTLVWRDGRATVERYWRLDYGRKHDGGPRETGERIRAALRRAVRRRMVSDVPLGAFLSGGIDSSAVVAAMAEASPQPVKTFSIGFDSEAHDELPRARMVARRFATDHQELTVTPDAVALLPKIVRHYGEPFADSSAVPSFYLAELASAQVTVALNGDGGDESFAGYQRYTTNVALGRLDAVPAPLRRAAAAVGRLASDSGGRGAVGRLARAARALPLDPRARYLAQISYLDRQRRRALYTDDYRAAVDCDHAAGSILEPWANSSATAPLDRLLDVDVRTYLPGDLLVKMDIASMAHSLEARSPLLDRELMELAAALPAHAKARGAQRKVAFRAALRGWVPDAVLDGPKRGFEIPLATWLRGDLREFARDVLLDRATVERGMLRPEVVAGMLDRHAAGSEDNAGRIWALLLLELWLRDVAAASSRPLATAA